MDYYYYGLLVYLSIIIVYLWIMNDYYNIYISCIKMYSGFVIHEIKLWCQFLDPLAVKPGVIFPPPAEPRGMLSMMITSGEMDSCDSAK
jgi:hypothetical protein